MCELYHYRIYFHGNPVGFIDNAMTKDEAVIRFANSNPEFALSGLTAVRD